MKRGQTTAGASQTRTSSSPVRSPTRSCSTRRVSSAAPHTGHAPLLLLLLSGVRGHCGHTATRARDGVAGASAYAASAQRKRPGTAAARTVATVLCGSVRSAGATSATISARNACGSGLRAGAAVAAGGGGVGSADAGVWCAQYASASATSQPAAVSRRATAGASAASTATLESTSCVISSISPSRIFALCTCPPPPHRQKEGREHTHTGMQMHMHKEGSRRDNKQHALEPEPLVRLDGVEHRALPHREAAHGAALRREQPQRELACARTARPQEGTSTGGHSAQHRER